MGWQSHQAIGICMNDQALKFLSQIQIFASLPEKELERVAQSTDLRSFAKNAILFSQGRSKLDGIYILQSGEIELYYEQEDRRSQISRLAKGEIFGAISVLMNSGICVRTAKVTREAKCYTIPVDVFLELCRNYRFFNKYFVDAFGQRMVDESYASIFASNRAFQFLSGIAPFSFLLEDELEKAAMELSLVFHPRNTVIFTQGLSKIESLYIIQSGAAERYFEESDHNVQSALMSEGDLFGGISMLINNSISIRSLRTTEDTHFYVWPKPCFLDACNRNKQFLEYFTDTFGKRMLDRSYASIVAKTIQPGEDALQFLNQPVSSITQEKLIFCTSGTTIQSAAELMSRHKCSSILIKSDQNIFVGIVTDNDLRQKVIASGLDIQNPVEKIMSFPLQTISAQALVFEALMRMMQENYKHLGVTGPEDEVIGIITNKDVLAAQGKSPLFLIREISTAGSIEALKQQYQLLPGVIQGLISNGAKARNLTRLITTISDAILNKVIAFALEKNGSAPCAFAFMVMGSEGRKEQTLKTDQDNAIVFEDVAGVPAETVQPYFLKLGQTICTWLNDVGYDFCKGNIMANNPKWCQPLSAWKEYFLSWIRVAESDDLLNSTIFFDFRCAHGKLELVSELRSSLMDALSEWPFFFRFMAQNAQHFKPPIGFFRNFIVESKGEHRDAFDIKKVMVPIVDFARIYALKHGLSETNTQERLHQLFMRKKLAWDTYNEMEHAYSFLMQLRFARQINALMVEKTAPDNYINPKKLSRIEQTMLKEIFSRIDNMQKEISYGLSNS